MGESFNDRFAPAEELEQQRLREEGKKLLCEKMQAVGRGYTVQELKGGIETPFGSVEGKRQYNKDCTVTDSGEVSVKIKGWGIKVGGQGTKKP